jgi:cytochrome oxidase Cu insertion factor (SCO1/SenC/PrrC family)
MRRILVAGVMLLVAGLAVQAQDKDKDKSKIGKSDLDVGKLAPDIEGEDIDGQKFKLSEYRGKVVLLDFWGHW